MIEYETMDICFSKMFQRVIDAIEKTDLENIFKTFSEIKEPTITTGVGGSSIVSKYLANVLREKNHIICEDKMPRSLLYEDISSFKNVIACSYSGNNIGVTASFKNDLKKYLFSGNKKDFAIPLQYKVLDEEFSFVSVAGTFAPMAIAFLYYTDNNVSLLKEILSSTCDFDIKEASDVYEAVYGAENSTAATMLDSTMTEGAIASVVLHERYNYCHGRCMLNDKLPHDLILFEDRSELGQLMEKEFNVFYKRVIKIDRKYEDDIVNDFYQTYMVMLLCKKIAETKSRDFCLKVIPEMSDRLYLFKGEMK